MNHFIAREGWPFIGTALAFFVLSAVVGLKTLAVFFFLLTVFVTWFFRNPDRRVPFGDNIIVSPADGTVISITEDNGVRKICIFMSVFNVHVNRVPCDGTVKKIDYNKGKFLVASKEKASLENEQNAVVIENNRGYEIKFVQIAGLVARRIVCYLTEGIAVRKGERFGMIRFGSRLDVYMPSVYTVDVGLKQKVLAGSTVLGSIKQ